MAVFNHQAYLFEQALLAGYVYIRQHVLLRKNLANQAHDLHLPEKTVGHSTPSRLFAIGQDKTRLGRISAAGQTPGLILRWGLRVLLETSGWLRWSVAPFGSWCHTGHAHFALFGTRRSIEIVVTGKKMVLLRQENKNGSLVAPVLCIIVPYRVALTCWALTRCSPCFSLNFNT